MSKKKVISHILVVAWMLVIFCMSAQPGDTSGEISGSVSHLFMRIWNAVFFQGWSEAEVLHMAQMWDYPIRKLAHMTEFGILAVLMYWALGYYKNRRYLAAGILTVCYAATDEFHQLFVPDRSGNALDVCVDACGAVIGLLVVAGINCVIRMMKSK